MNIIKYLYTIFIKDLKIYLKNDNSLLILYIEDYK